jgi:hypothetical protein
MNDDSNTIWCNLYCLYCGVLSGLIEYEGIIMVSAFVIDGVYTNTAQGTSLAPIAARYLVCCN